MSEREVFAEIRVCQRNVDMIDDPTMRRQMVERYVREDALVSMPHWRVATASGPLQSGRTGSI